LWDAGQASSLRPLCPTAGVCPPVGYEEGSLGWVVDQPAFVFPDGSAMQTRCTAVMRQEEGRWKLVHMHLSVGVPDEEVVEL
jgi:hypothetical protein